MPKPPGWELERYLPLLRVQARQLHLDPRLRRRFDSSDLVGETLLKACAELPGFRGTTEAQLVAWLQQILAHCAIDLVRREKAGKRDVALERSLQAAAGESSARLEAFLKARGPSPSEEAQQHEELLRLAAAIEQLPERERDVLILRKLMNLPVAAIAEQLGRTKKAVAGQLQRGLHRLSKALSERE
jgi:RNA polymerase sigma-70 factor (ECF subfamily)